MPASGVFQRAAVIVFLMPLSFASLALTSRSAMAEWVMVGENKILALTAYADPHTDVTSRNGKTIKTIKMWRLYDYKTTQEASGYQFISAKFQDEYDCKEVKSRLLSNSVYPENMGGGAPVFTEPSLGKWQPIVLGGIDEALFKFACGKR
jgi:hypothetical protein